MGGTLFSVSICESGPPFYFLIFHLKPAQNREKMKKPALVDLCVTFGLKHNGNKPDLSNRLRDFSCQRALWER